jgi:GcrA cell cycle regulator
MRLGECGVVCWVGLYFFGGQPPPALGSRLGHSGSARLGRAPIFASRFRVLAVARCARTNALSAAQTGRGTRARPFAMSPSIAPSNSIPSSPIPASPIAPVAPALLDPATIARAKNLSRANPNATWTPERMTCSQIAAAIGVSRNAVIGKIHRLGLSSGRPAGAPARANCPPRARHPRGPTQRRLLRLAYAQTPLDAIMSDVVVISLHPCSLVDIDHHQCRWPIGDPASPKFLFCGNDAIRGFAYCVGHARMAYRPSARR